MRLPLRVLRRSAAARFSNALPPAVPRAALHTWGYWQVLFYISTRFSRKYLRALEWSTHLFHVVLLDNRETPALRGCFRMRKLSRLSMVEPHFINSTLFWFRNPKIFFSHPVEMVRCCRYGHLFDAIIINKDLEESTTQLLHLINDVETKPTWVPLSWATNLCSEWSVCSLLQATPIWPLARLDEPIELSLSSLYLLC